MLDIGWSEMAVIALLTLIVIGPKELPRVLRTVGHWVRKAQSLAREFQSGLDQMVREAELEDAKKLVDTGRNLNVNKIVEQTIDPGQSMRGEATELEAAVRDKAPAGAAGTAADETAPPEAGEPAKAETPGDAGAPDETPEAASPEAAPPKATIIKHPVQMAPPHSLTPPPEPDAEADLQAEAEPAPKDGSQKTA